MSTLSSDYLCFNREAVFLFEYLSGHGKTGQAVELKILQVLRVFPRPCAAQTTGCVRVGFAMNFSISSPYLCS